MRKILALAASLGVAAAACATAEAPADDSSTASAGALTVIESFVSHGTGYYPDDSRMEGGFRDMRGARLRTLQQYLDGEADYVAIAMDTRVFHYGQRLRIKELEAKYGRSIVFRVVDTGGAFRGKGRSRMDICTANRSASLDPTINGTLHVDAIAEGAGPAFGTNDDEDVRTCSNDGDCNPGDEGAGLICQSRRCVAGCRNSDQCPGSQRCSGGQCR
jgi:3D (Asp-Asp-Asp) domain-containing protein